MSPRVTPAQIALWAQQRGLDPASVLAVAGQEGLGGGIGDGGHAFGPFQLNNAGGVITGKFGGQSPEQINEWAWSPEGVSYALAGIQGVAGGLKGDAATRAIVYNFERPADPAGEYSRASGNPVAASMVPQARPTAASQQAQATTPVGPSAPPPRAPQTARRQLPAAVQAALQILRS